MRLQTEQRSGPFGRAGSSAPAWLSARCASSASADGNWRPQSAQAAPTSSYSTYGTARGNLPGRKWVVPPAPYPYPVSRRPQRWQNPTCPAGLR